MVKILNDVMIYVDQLCIYLPKVYRTKITHHHISRLLFVNYSSNLCHEIVQNMSTTQHIEDTLLEDGTIVHKKKSGDVVVWNLGSITLGKVYPKLVHIYHHIV